MSSRYVRDPFSRAIFLKDSSAIRKREEESRLEARLQDVENQIHKLREMLESLLKNKDNQRQ